MLNLYMLFFVITLLFKTIYSLWLKIMNHINNQRKYLSTYVCMYLYVYLCTVGHSYNGKMLSSHFSILCQKQLWFLCFSPLQFQGNSISISWLFCFSFLSLLWIEEIVMERDKMCQVNAFTLCSHSTFKSLLILPK